jgi:hypothetical protein
MAGLRNPFRGCGQIKTTSDTSEVDTFEVGPGVIRVVVYMASTWQYVLLLV